MSISYDNAHDLAEAAFEAYTLPNDFIVEATSGFSSETSSDAIEFSKPVFYYDKADEHLLDTDDFNTSTAYFNIKVDPQSGEISDVYLITQKGGNIVGEFSEMNRRAAYEAANLIELVPATSLTP